MRASMLTGVAVTATALAVVLSGCGSDSKPVASSSSSSSPASSASPTSKKAAPTVPPTPSAEAAGPNQTIADYIKQNNIQESVVKMGDPSAPAVNLPVPDGWEVVSPEQTPDYAYGAIVYNGPEFASDQPNIVALMSKLTGDVDPQKIIAVAPGELNNSPTISPAIPVSPALWAPTRPTCWAAVTPATDRPG